ncbi:MAG: biopolymer transporter ExbB [Paracoccaceae bacterium]
MERPVRQAAALFSQPVQQILLVFLVCILVSFGGWLVFGKISHVVLENPWLNGLIFGVFLLGIIGCFWQLVQIIASVRWIEGYASAREGHEMTVAPRLLATLSHLLRSRGAKGGHISSTAARAMLESVSARIEEARDITRYLTNLLIFLGLLGTLYGLSVTVPAVVDTIRALSPKEGETSAEVFSKLMTGLESQLGGMGTAFSSSLLGLAGSLVVGLLELFASHGQNRFYGELEEWLSRFTRLSLTDGEAEGGGPNVAMEMLLEHLDEQAGYYAELRERAATEQVQLNEGLMALAQAVDAMSLKLEHGLTSSAGALAGTMADAMSDAMAGMIAGQDALLERTDRIAVAAQAAQGLLAARQDTDGFEGDGVGDAESRMRLRSIDKQMLRLLEEVAAGRQETLAELRGDLAGLTRAVRALARLDQAAGDGSPDRDRH